MTLPTHTWNSQAPKCISPSILEWLPMKLLNLLAFFSLVLMYWHLDRSCIYCRSHRYWALTFEFWLIIHCKSWVTLLHLSSPSPFWVANLDSLLGLQWEKCHSRALQSRCHSPVAAGRVSAGESPVLWFWWKQHLPQSLAVSLPLIMPLAISTGHSLHPCSLAPL